MQPAWNTVCFKKHEYDSKKNKPRPILVKLRREDDANYLHCNGRGYRLTVGGVLTDMWINQDLTKAEREAAYKKRHPETTAENTSVPKNH